MLLGWLAGGKSLELDLENVEEIDITILQLVWAAAREAAARNVGLAVRASGAVMVAARAAGFDNMPGLSRQG